MMCNRIPGHNLNYSPINEFDIGLRKEAFPGIAFITNTAMRVQEIKAGFMRIVYLLPIYMHVCILVRIASIGIGVFLSILYKGRIGSKAMLQQTLTN